jgi:hypothetical protein
LGKCEDLSDPCALGLKLNVTVRPFKKSKERKVVKRLKKGKKVTYRVKISNSGNAEVTGVRLKVRGEGIRSKM